MANPIKELIESTINSLDGMFTSESILGETVTAPDGTMIIPMSRVSFGVGGGGCEFKETNTAGNNLFGGGVGAGATVKPEGFLVITKWAVYVLCQQMTAQILPKSLSIMHLN